MTAAARKKKKGAAGRRPEGINGVLKKGLARYFALLDGQPPARLHGMVMGEVEKALLEHTMKNADFNRTQAARILGISRATLRKKLARYKITEGGNRTPKNRARTGAT